MLRSFKNRGELIVNNFIHALQLWFTAHPWGFQIRTLVLWVLKFDGTA